MCLQALRLTHHGICSVCLRMIPSLLSPCRYCGLPATHQDTCYRCQVTEPSWQHLIAVSPYDKPLKSLIHRFKFSGKSELGAALARLMVLSWLNARREYGLVKPDYVVPVPLTRRKHWKRGYNHAALLAKPLAHALGARYCDRMVVRGLSHFDQKVLSAMERKNNVMNVFSCQSTVAGKCILLVDDVVTTGSTIAAICEELKQKNPKEIQVICVCRTL